MVDVDDDEQLKLRKDESLSLLEMKKVERASHRAPPVLTEGLAKIRTQTSLYASNMLDYEDATPAPSQSSLANRANSIITLIRHKF